MPPPDPYPPRSLALVEGALRRLQLRPASGFGFSAVLGVFAVAGGLLLPRLFGKLAGSLLAMQFLVILFIVFLLSIVFARRISLVQMDPERQREARWITAWLIDAEVVLFLIGSVLVGGIFGPLEFIALAGATFLGALREERGPRELAEGAVRCGLAFVALVAVSAACGLPRYVDEWPGARGSILAAGLYFGLLAIAEATPLYAWTIARALAIGARLRRPVPPA